MAHNQHILDGLFSALADPTRREVIGRLCSGPATVSALSSPFDMALPSFMKHLHVLEESGLILTRKEGRVRTCRLNPKTLNQAEIWLRRQQARWEQRADRMAAHAEQITKTGA